MAMCNFLELLIALRFGELDDVAAQLKPSNAFLSALSQTPDEWAEQLSHVATLWEYTGRLPAEFAGFVGRAK